MMKRKTLIALGIAGAFACGSASAATYLCTQSGGASVSCAPIPSEVLGSITSSEDAAALSQAPAITYYLVPIEPDQVALLDLTEPSDVQSAPSDTPSSAAFGTGNDARAMDLSSADQWQHSEPRSMTYFSSPDAN